MAHLDFVRHKYCHLAGMLLNVHLQVGHLIHNALDAGVQNGLRTQEGNWHNTRQQLENLERTRLGAR